MTQASAGTQSSIGIGSVIAETYAVEVLLGRGGMGAVFLASHLRLPGKKVAVKILHTEIANPEVLQRFRREAEIASRLGHPNIVTVHDFNTLADGTPYLVLEYLKGEALTNRIEKGPMQLQAVRDIVNQVASGLGAAHAHGIVHRDLKPDNIFLVPTEIGGRAVEQVKILDFGISKIRGSTTVNTLDATVLGTPQYMSPEQALGENAKSDARTDVYALGVIVYEMLAGRPSFNGDSVLRIMYQVVHEAPPDLAGFRPDLPPATLDAVRRAMSKKQEDRFNSALEFAAALGGDVPAVPSGYVLPGTEETIAASQQVPPVSRVNTGAPGAAPFVSNTGNAAPVSVGGSGGVPVSALAQTLAGAEDAVRGPSTSPSSSKRGMVIGGVALVGALSIAGAWAMRAKPEVTSSTPIATSSTTTALTSPTVALSVSTSVPASGNPTIGKPTIENIAVPTTSASVAATIDPGPKSSASPKPGKRTDDHVPSQTSDNPLVKEAENALASGDRDLANRLANRLINEGGSADKVVGWTIQGVMACKKNDASVAGQMYRLLANSPSGRKRMERACVGSTISLK